MEQGRESQILPSCFTYLTQQSHQRKTNENSFAGGILRIGFVLSRHLRKSIINPTEDHDEWDACGRTSRNIVASNNEKLERFDQNTLTSASGYTQIDTFCQAITIWDTNT